MYVLNNLPHFLINIIVSPALFIVHFQHLWPSNPLIQTPELSGSTCNNQMPHENLNLPFLHVDTDIDNYFWRLIKLNKWLNNLTTNSINLNKFINYSHNYKFNCIHFTVNWRNLHEITHIPNPKWERNLKIRCIMHLTQDKVIPFLIPLTGIFNDTYQSFSSLHTFADAAKNRN